MPPLPLILTYVTRILNMPTLDLVTYCEKENVPFTTFNDFSDILAVVKDVVSGKVSVKDAATGRN